MVQIGIINYLNSIPYVAPYLLGIFKSNFSFVFAPPSHLNQLIDQKQIPLSFVSSYFYLKNENKLELIEGFGIGSDGPVQSVSLFYPKGITSFDDIEVALDPESATSNALAKWFLERIRGEKPLYIYPDIRTISFHTAFVLIGDKALRFVLPDGYDRIDLAEQWKSFTGVPILFSLFVGEKKFVQENREVVEDAKEELSCGLKWSLENFEKAVTCKRQEESLADEAIISYWKGISYFFDSRFSLSIEIMKKELFL